ncbi:MAG TPA: glycosyl hydrolase family 18 protein [Pyrinomonadaceae bacterium]|nr:glycosyl hydrolase family 18 protein [Pyrinomonadaceae bacterium]
MTGNYVSDGQGAQAGLPRLVTYWLGYHPTSQAGTPTPPLNQTPSYYDVITLAFALVRPGNAVDTTFLCTPPNTEDQIKSWMRDVQQAGQKVSLCVGGWAGNCWDTVTDQGALADQIVALVEDWGFDGVDFDYEGDRPLDGWPPCDSSGGSQFDPDAFVPVLRGKLADGKLLTAPVATFLFNFQPETVALFDWIATMDYQGASDYDDLVSQYGFSKVILGVSSDQPLDQVQQLCRHVPPNAPSDFKLSMMFWNVSSDNPGDTGQPLWTWSNTINENLPQ